MNIWIVEPVIRVGEINFGMARTEVRKILGEYKEFKKSKYSKNTTDDFSTCHVFYDGDNKCEAVEIFDGIEVRIGGSIIFPGDFKDGIENLRLIDKDLKIEKDGCISKDKSIGIYAPEDKMESILLGNVGYYD